MRPLPCFSPSQPPFKTKAVVEGLWKDCLWRSGALHYIIDHYETGSRYMAQVTISEAARRVGVARSTLLRHIKNGKVSKVIGKDGTPRLDTSELLRVYGDLKNSDQIDTGDTLHQNRSTLQVDIGDRYTEKDIEIATLRAELKAAIERADEFKEERDEWRGVAKKGQALLTDAGQGKPRQGLWARVFGKSV